MDPWSEGAQGYHFTRIYGRYVELVNRGCKPTNVTRGHHFVVMYALTHMGERTPILFKVE
jgi:hypothetical protein